MKKSTLLLCVCLFIFAVNTVFGQSCPQNIGFEIGNFTNWRTYSGTVANASGNNVITLSASPVLPDRHAINSTADILDVYGRFPILAPNGSKKSVKLGNSGTGRQAEGISYLITVPANQPTFVLTYQYAVVFQNPNHTLPEQPKFMAKVLDMATGAYVQCASFEYVSTASLPGFNVSPVAANVLYKAWTPVTIDLTGYQGKQLLLEFVTADCTQGGHFGYAYVDVNENCNGLIAGAEQCPDAVETNLQGPSGYQNYKWYNEDRSKLYGEGQKIKITPAITPGNAVLLDLVPFDGFGCPNTVRTSITEVNYEIQVLATDNLCSGDAADLISDKYILNKSPDITYRVFRDEELTDLVSLPSQILQSGTYYIEGMLASGCTSVKPVVLDFYDIPVIVSPRIDVCIGVNVDLTSSQAQDNIPTNAVISYFSNSALTIAVPDPTRITVSGTYYIRYVTTRCTIVKAIAVAINPIPVLVVTSPPPLCTGQFTDLTAPSITVGSDISLNYTYFTDAALTIPVVNPRAVSTPGNYYIKGSNTNSCSISAMITVVVNTPPVLVVRNPPIVCEPATIDITDPNLYVGTSAGVNYSYTDDKGVPITNPSAITKSGIYMVTVTNNLNCSVTKTIQVMVNLQPVPQITQPKKVFIGQSVNLANTAIIKGSTGYNKVSYWLDDQMTTPIANPRAITTDGTYYIAFTSEYGCVTVAAVNVISVPPPKILVPTAFTPLKSTNNLLYPFFEGIQKLNSFKIYNKWGNLVYETSSMDAKDGWNGTFRNAIQPFETYSWFAEGINMLDEVFTTKGKTVLIP